MPTTPHPTPKELTNSWLDEPSPDPAGEVARQFVVNLRSAMGETSIRRAASKITDRDQLRSEHCFDSGSGATT